MNSLDPVNQAVFPSHLSSVLLRYCSPLPPAWVSASLSPDTDTRSRRLRRLVTGAGDIAFCISVTIFVSDHCLSWFSLCDSLWLGHLCSLQRPVPGPVSWSGYLAHNCPLSASLPLPSITGCISGGIVFYLLQNPSLFTKF